VLKILEFQQSDYKRGAGEGRTRGSSGDGTGRDGTGPHRLRLQTSGFLPRRIRPQQITLIQLDRDGEDLVLTLDTRVLQRSHLSGRYRYRKLNQLGNASKVSPSDVLKLPEIRRREQKPPVSTERHVSVEENVPTNIHPRDASVPFSSGLQNHSESRSWSLGTVCGRDESQEERRGEERRGEERRGEERRGEERRERRGEERRGEERRERRGEERRREGGEERTGQERRRGGEGGSPQSYH
ncbi:hypothetical protein D4764_20G0005900, partial [Takifugu flavidus]